MLVPEALTKLLLSVDSNHSKLKTPVLGLTTARPVVLRFAGALPLQSVASPTAVGMTISSTTVTTTSLEY